MTFLRFEDNGPRDSSVLAFFKSNFGFVPNVFRDQMLRFDIVQAEANLIDSVLLKQGALTRFQKECILLVVSAGNSNTYSVALLGQTLEILGISREESDQIAVDHHDNGVGAGIRHVCFSTTCELRIIAANAQTATKSVTDVTKITTRGPTT